MSEELRIEHRIAMEDNALELGVTQLGTPSLYTCPECHGVLVQLHGGAPLRFRCHTGHAFTAEVLAAAGTDVIEDQLWSVVRAMDEHVVLLRQLAEHLHAAGNGPAAERLLDQVGRVQRQTQTLRLVVLGSTVIPRSANHSATST